MRLRTASLALAVASIPLVAAEASDLRTLPDRQGWLMGPKGPRSGRIPNAAFSPSPGDMRGGYPAGSSFRFYRAPQGGRWMRGGGRMSGGMGRR
jgi:hypothetical protein